MPTPRQELTQVPRQTPAPATGNRQPALVQEQEQAPNPVPKQNSSRIALCNVVTHFAPVSRFDSRALRTVPADGAPFPPTPIDYSQFTAWRCHESSAWMGMHNPQSSSILEHALQVATLARPLVESIQRKDRDLASQVRRAISSIALNTAEAQGSAGGNCRVRLETALGSLYEAHAGIRLAVAWGYLSQVGANELLASMHRLGGRLFGLVRK